MSQPAAASPSPPVTRRIRVAIHGAVQGVGFRPFIYRLSRQLGLTGWVLNSSRGVVIEAEADAARLERFLLRIEQEKPPHAFIQSLEFRFLDPVGYTAFEIRPSDEGGAPTALVLPDIATCPECLAELFDERDRRYRYPFINCTHCGPRYSIIESLPYDRPGTSMKRFLMCPDCRREYEDPADRRFHAQPNACPRCGPSLEFRDDAGRKLSERDEALYAALEVLGRGQVLAVKGIGGFHLMVSAGDEDAVLRLRRRKHREEKPFALMCPDLASARELCSVSELEERLLCSPQAPIVLLHRRPDGTGASPSVAPSNPFLGVMLPYAPLHHLLLHDAGMPLVATSGNLSDEPICIDEEEAVVRLRGIADAFLVHDRPILRHIDDSVVRVSINRELVLRRARGYAPLPITLAREVPEMLAVGAHLKNTVAVSRGRNVFVSQHLGDLDTQQSLAAFRHEIGELTRLYAVCPTCVVSDLHPDYLSTAYARESGFPHVAVQHHYAHVASCMAENELEGSVLGVSWDGTGYGPDGTVWGGEFLLTTPEGYRRVGTLRKFRLPGGEAAVREPRRSALGLLHELFGGWGHLERSLPPLLDCTEQEEQVMARMLETGLNSPWTSSAGRLFDAAASLAGLRQRSTYEGQAAMELEWAATLAGADDCYPFTVASGGEGTDEVAGVVDWGPMIGALLADAAAGRSAGVLAARFHNTLAEMITTLARTVNERRVVLSGGCFQNRYLTERTVRRLEQEGFRPYWHQRIPPNDGGISLGQAYAAALARQRPSQT